MNPYSSKFKPLARERGLQVWGVLAQECRGRTARGPQLKLRRPRVDDRNMSRQCRGQRPVYTILQRGLVTMAL